MKNLSTPLVLIAALTALAAPFGAQAQTTGGSVADDFTGTSTSNPWYFFNGACLTASTLNGVEPTTSSSGQVPGCTTIGTTYYNQPLVGGQNGVAGNTQTLPDPSGQGALRFTNGQPGGFSQNGGILSTTPFPTGSGVSITFKTVTYRGNSGGAGGDGADGISFFLMDSSALDTTSITGTAAGDGNGLGSWGGSLGYTCSNANPPYNGLVGAYLGLGIDEYGNFLNGAQLMAGYTGSNSATGDNSAARLRLQAEPHRPARRRQHRLELAARELPDLVPEQLHRRAAECRRAADLPERRRLGLRERQPGLHGQRQYHPDLRLCADPERLRRAALHDQDRERGGHGARWCDDHLLPAEDHAERAPEPVLRLCPAVGGCGAYQSVIQGQSITASNGPLPTSFLFGFAGSTGGDTNIHEILCFKADPVTTAASGAGAQREAVREGRDRRAGLLRLLQPEQLDRASDREHPGPRHLRQRGHRQHAQLGRRLHADRCEGRQQLPHHRRRRAPAAQAPTDRVILTSTGGTGSGIPFAVEQPHHGAADRDHRGRCHADPRPRQLPAR